MLYISEDITNPTLLGTILAEANLAEVEITENPADATMFIAMNMGSFPLSKTSTQKILLVDPQQVIAVSTKVHLFSRFTLRNIDSDVGLTEFLENQMFLMAAES